MKKVLPYLAAGLAFMPMDVEASPQKAATEELCEEMRKDPRIGVEKIQGGTRKGIIYRDTAKDGTNLIISADCRWDKAGRLDSAKFGFDEGESPGKIFTGAKTTRLYDDPADGELDWIEQHKAPKIRVKEDERELAQRLFAGMVKKIRHRLKYGCFLPADKSGQRHCPKGR